MHSDSDFSAWECLPDSPPKANKGTEIINTENKNSLTYANNHQLMKSPLFYTHI
jgi:hypothetical protein